MVGIRVIPCLLWQGGGLVKTTKFKQPNYIGDATNAIRIFNEKEVDELMLLDIEASVKGRRPNLDLIRQIASECFMPLAYGGGVSTLEDIRNILSLGVEKVCINSKAVQDPEFIRQAGATFGNSTIVVCIDYRKTLLGKNVVTGLSGSNKSKYDPLQFAKLMEEMGAGELVLNSIDRDGTMTGYDIEMIRKVTDAVSIPVIALGGAGTTQHLFEAIDQTHVSAVAAGSMFVYQGKHKAVLINYPDRKTFAR